MGYTKKNSFKDFAEYVRYLEVALRSELCGRYYVENADDVIVVRTLEGPNKMVLVALNHPLDTLPYGMMALVKQSGKFHKVEILHVSLRPWFNLYLDLGDITIPCDVYGNPKGEPVGGRNGWTKYREMKNECSNTGKPRPIKYDRITVQDKFVDKGIKEAVKRIELRLGDKSCSD